MPRRLDFLNRIRGQKTVTPSSLRRWIAANCSCRRRDRTQYQATSESICAVSSCNFSVRLFITGFYIALYALEAARANATKSVLAECRGAELLTPKNTFSF